jgi:membrane protein implicated in regulation of membrane protease activity
VNPTVSLVFAIVAFAAFVVLLRSLTRARQEKKKRQQEQHIKDEYGGRKQMM